MNPELLLYTGALAIACGLSLAIASFAWLRRDTPGALAFMFSNICGFCYSLGSIFEIHAQTDSAVLAALSLEYVGIAFIGPLWFLTVYGSKPGNRPLKPSTIAWLMVVPVIVLGAVITNDFHHLYYTSSVVQRQGAFSVPSLGKGPIYLVNMVYMNGGIFLGTVLAFRNWQQAGKGFRASASLLLLGSLFPWTGMFLYQSGLSPYGLDTAPFGLAMSGLFFAIALFRFRLFDLVPLAYEHIFASMNQAVLVIDKQNRLVGLNPAMAKLGGEPVAPAIGCNLASGCDWCPGLGPVLSGASTSLEVPGAEGNRLFESQVSVFRDRHQRDQGRIFIFTDITHHKAFAEQLSILARTDELTGLANRRAFMETLNSEWDRQNRYPSDLTMIMFDIDHFKRINDRFGHAFGDLALQHLVASCKACLRAMDSLARYGGEEFAVICPQANQTEGLKIAERMRQAIQDKPLQHAGKTIPLHASFGVACQDPAMPDIDAFIRQADAALYRAKKFGRNRVEGAS